jgi:hypothetical protein
MSRYTYTKVQLEQIVYTQLENLDAMNDLLRIMKLQFRNMVFFLIIDKYWTA